MSLRSRLLAGFTLVMSLLLVTAVVVVNNQSDRLVEQLDDQLEAIAPLAFPPGAPLQNRLSPPQATSLNPDSPVSNVFVATIDESGGILVIQQGQLLESQPNLDGQSANLTNQHAFLSLDAAEGSSRFRALLLPSQANSVSGLVAIPLDDVEQTVDRLIYGFVVLGLLILIALATVGWWMIRLGLRPITEMTLTAEAIASGEKTKRATETNRSTEAGKLGVAFNTMLDQRDGAEDRLRQFVSDASHELRTPLTSIRGYLDLYASGGFRETGELDDIIARMQQESARMTTLVEDLLTLAKLDEHRLISKTPTDVNRLLRECINDTRASHPLRSLTHTESAAAITVPADATRLQQVILILLNNAIVHTPESSNIRLHAILRRGAIEIVVEDDGPGMSAETAEHIFDRFYRGDSARTRATGGSGLGLAIAKSIVEAHGGELTVVAAIDLGCTFRICLPTDS